MDRDERREYWQAVLELHRESGMTIQGFCKREGLSVHQFGYWRKRLVDLAETPPEEFVPLRFSDERSPESILVRIGPFAVEVPTKVDPEELKRVLLTVAEVAC